MAHTRNKGNRRADLLKVTREIFAEKGYEATTVSEIVARAGVAQGTFYWHFPSKVSLVVTLAQEMQEQIEGAIRTAYLAYLQTKDLGHMIDMSVEGAFRIMGQYRDVLGIILSGVHWSEALAERERIFTPYYNLISEMIRQEQGRGTINTSINAEAASVLIVGTVYYTAAECYIYKSAITAEMFTFEAAQFVRRALGIS